MEKISKNHKPEKYVYDEWSGGETEFANRESYFRLARNFFAKNDIWTN